MTMTEFISYDEFKKLVDEKISSISKAGIISTYLKNKIFIYEKELYKIQANFICERIDTIEKKFSEHLIFNEVSKLISDSFNNLQQSEKDFISSQKLFTMLIKNSFIKNIYSQLLFKISYEYELDEHKNGIHFKNGYIDVNTLEFKQRTKFITSYINRDYKKSSENDKKIIDEIITKIYPFKQDRECVLKILGSSFSGKVVNDRTSLFLLGKSSAGKSVIMKLLRLAFSECYVQEFASDTFEKGNKNSNKIFNEFLKKKNIRISWVNEINSTRIDISLFKKFCEGLLQTVSLYKDGINSVKHNSKVISTSNEMPNLQIDSGISSRVLAYNHISKFTNNKDEVDEKKKIFLGDKDLIDKIEQNDNLLNAITDYILEYTNNWIKCPKIKYPKSFLDARDEIINCNDYIQDFIDSKIIFTNNPKDKISKNKMTEEYLKKFPTKKINNQQLIGALKDKGLTFSPNARCDDMRGAYLSVKLRPSNNNYNYNFLDGTVSQSEHDKALQKIKDLEQQLEKYKKLLEEQKKEEPEKEPEKEQSALNLFLEF